MSLHNAVGSGPQGARDYRFSLNFVALSAFLPRVLELFSVSKMPIAQREKQWRAKLIDLQRNTKFDPSWLVDLHEHMILEMAGTRQRRGLGRFRWASKAAGTLRFRLRL